MTDPSDPGHPKIQVDDAAAAGPLDLDGRPGYVLRQTRRQLGYDLRTVARELRLTPERVAAIENDDHQALPDPVFVAGYVKNYARLLGLDAEAMAAAYRATIIPPAPPMPPADAETSLPKEKTINWQFRESQWAAIAGMLLVLILALSWWLQKPANEDKVVRAARPIPDAVLQTGNSEEQQGGEDDEENGYLVQPPDEILDEPPEDLEEAGAGDGKHSMAAEALKAPPPAQGKGRLADDSATTPVKETRMEADVAQGVEKLDVVVSFSGPTFIDIRDSTLNYALIGEMEQGDRHLLGGKPPYSFIIGNAAATQIEVGGQPFDYQSVVRGNVARFILDPAPKSPPPKSPAPKSPASKSSAP